MGKLSAYLAQRKDLEFDFEREVRAVRDLLAGVHRIGGREHTLSLAPGDSFVAEGHARAILVRELEAGLRDMLVRYLHNLCLEGCRLGISSALFEDALRANEAIPARAPAVAAAPTATVTPLASADAEQPAAASAPAAGHARELQDALSAAFEAA